MAKLIVKSGSQVGRELELEPGLHRVGRSAENDISIPEPSISSVHCELSVAEIGVSVHDLGSTNGTFINGQQVLKGMVGPGDVLRLGDINFEVVLPEVNIAIPTATEEAPGAAFLEDGSPGCFNHRVIAAIYTCTGCENWWCLECVRQIKRLSGDFLTFCPQCSAPCIPLPRGDDGRPRRSFFQRVSDTLRITRKK